MTTERVQNIFKNDTGSLPFLSRLFVRADYVLVLKRLKIPF